MMHEFIIIIIYLFIYLLNCHVENIHVYINKEELAVSAADDRSCIC